MTLTLNMTRCLRNAMDNNKISSCFLQGFEDVLQENLQSIQESYEIDSCNMLVEKVQEPISCKKERVLERLDEAKFNHVRPSRVLKPLDNS